MSVWSEIDEHLHFFVPVVLSFVDDAGYPFTLRARARQDLAGDVFRVELPDDVPAVEGPAWLLWHHHDAMLDDHHVLAVRGHLARGDGEWRVHPERVLASGYGDPSTIGDRTDGYLRSRGLTAPEEIPWGRLKEIAERVLGDRATVAGGAR